MYPLDKINDFLDKYNNNITIKEISLHLDISYKTIHIWIDKFKYFIENKRTIEEEEYLEIQNNKKRHGLNKKYKYIDDILLYVKNNKGCSLDDIYNSINKQISKSTICSILKENNISRKRVNTRIICKDEEILLKERKEFSNNLDTDKFINNIFIDESSFCINDIIKYGYSKKGVSITKLKKHKHNKQRYTLLASIDKTEGIKYEIIKGSVDRNIYLDFITKHKTYFENKTLVQDNARIHHAKLVKDYCLNNNINLVYNPPYTPEFNPIELIFNTIKSKFRKLDHFDLKEDIIESINSITLDNIEKSIYHSLKSIVSYKNI